MTSGGGNPADNELRRIARMLERTTKMAEHATLTGSMAGGKEFAVRSYNGVRNHLVGLGEVPEALFPPLPDDAGLDDVAIASAQLAEYLRAGLAEHREKVMGDGNVMINLGHLGEIAEMVRENLPEWLRSRARERQRPASSGEPRPHPEGAAASAAAEANAPSAGLDDLRPGGSSAGQQGPESSVDRRRQVLEDLRAGRITPDEAIARLQET